jgi:RNA polymerase sigma factor (TIGR02999 family)
VAENITQLLRDIRTGDKNAEARLIELVYDELHEIAARNLRRERPGHTLQATALVNEAYMRLTSLKETDWKSRAHFFAVAAQVMRHILVDYARNRLSEKRGAGLPALPIDEALTFSDDRLEQLLVLEDALQKLENQDSRANQVVVMRFYGGLSMEEIAEVLQVSTRTVKRDWNYGRAWLKSELGPKTGDDASITSPH